MSVLKNENKADQAYLETCCICKLLKTYLSLKTQLSAFCSF